MMVDVRKGQIWGNENTGETIEILEVDERRGAAVVSWNGIRCSWDLELFEKQKVILLEDSGFSEVQIS